MPSNLHPLIQKGLEISEKATKGKWSAHTGNGTNRKYIASHIEGLQDDKGLFFNPSDADFIVAAKSQYDTLLKIISEQQKALESLHAAADDCGFMSKTGNEVTITYERWEDLMSSRDMASECLSKVEALAKEVL